MRRTWVRVGLLLLSLFVVVPTAQGFEWEGRLARLQRELSTGDAARRREVVRLLASYPAHEVREALLQALADSDAGVRAEAAEASGRVRLREAAPRLLDWLDDPEPDVRESAARALGRIGEPRTVPPLVRALGDAHVGVRRAAVQALATIGTPEVVVPLLDRLDDLETSVRVEAASALGRIRDPRAAVPLIGRARDEAPEVRVAVFAALGDLGDPRATPALVQALRDDAEEARLSAIAALGQLRDPTAVEPLRALLSAGAETRSARAIVAALGWIPSPDAIGAVVEVLGRNDVQEEAVRVLVMRARRARLAGGEDAEQGNVAALVDRLAAALDAAPTSARATALANVLGRLDGVAPIERAAPALLRALAAGRGDGSTLMQTVALTGAPEALVPLLEHLRPPERPADPEAILPGREPQQAVSPERMRLQAAAIGALDVYFQRAPADGRAADPLLAILGAAPPALRVHVVRLLGRARAARALPDLRPLLAHRDPELRLAAVEAIGRIGDPEGAPALLELLDDREPRTRFEAARALGDAAGPEMVVTLLDRAASREPTDRHAVISALGRALRRLEAARTLPAATRARAVRTLGTIAQGEDRALAARAVDALGRWGASDAAAPLLALTEAPSATRRRDAARALGHVRTPEAARALEGLLRDRRPDVVAAAAIALGEHGRGATAPALLRIAGSAPWPASAAASFAVARLARRGAVPAAEDTRAALCRLASSRDPYVRANAATALAALGSPACDDRIDPLRWLDPAHAPPVRAAAARWADAGARSGASDAAAVRTALERCGLSDPDPTVSAACHEPGLPELSEPAEVYAWSSDRRRLLTDTLVALRLADGSVLVTHTDATGLVHLSEAPHGTLVLEDPSATPLER